MMSYKEAMRLEGVEPTCCEPVETRSDRRLHVKAIRKENERLRKENLALRKRLALSGK